MLFGVTSDLESTLSISLKSFFQFSPALLVVLLEGELLIQEVGLFGTRGGSSGVEGSTLRVESSWCTDGPGRSSVERCGSRADGGVWLGWLRVVKLDPGESLMVRTLSRKVLDVRGVTGFDSVIVAAHRFAKGRKCK